MPDASLLTAPLTSCSWHPQAGKEKPGIPSATSSTPGLPEHPAWPRPAPLLFTAASLAKAAWLLSHSRDFYSFLALAPCGRCLWSPSCAAMEHHVLPHTHAPRGWEKLGILRVQGSSLLCVPWAGPRPLCSVRKHIPSKFCGLWIGTRAAPETFPWQCSH